MVALYASPKPSASSSRREFKINYPWRLNRLIVMIHHRRIDHQRLCAIL
jgi:hypothetical protein